MRKRADEKFQKEVIEPIETERETIEIKSEKQVQALFEEIQAVYKYMVHKIYFTH